MFEVVYSYGKDLEFKLESKVYAVDHASNSFLIVDGWGKFHWASIDRCKLNDPVYLCGDQAASG